MTTETVTTERSALLLHALPSADEYVEAARQRARRFAVWGLLLAFVTGGAFVAFDLDNPILPLALLIAVVTPILLWRYPRFVLYSVFTSVCLFEMGQTGQPDALTDRVPIFWNINTIFQVYAHTNFKGMPFSLLEIFVVMAAVCSLFRSVYTGTTNLRAGALLAPIALYVGCVTVGWVNGILNGGDFKISLEEVRSQFFFLIAYLMAVNILRERRQIGTLLWISVLCIGLKGILYTFRRYVTLGGMPLPDQGVGSHEEAFLFDAFVMLLLVLWLCGVHKRLQMVMLFLLPFVMTGNLACNRRAATAAMIIAIPALLLAAYRALPERRKLVGSFAIVLTVGFAVYYPAFKNSDSLFAQPARAIQSNFQPDARDASSNAARDAENANLMATIKTVPLQGTGYGRRYLHVVPMADISKIYELEDYLPHNQVLWVWERVGSLGFLVFWVMVGAIIIRAGLTIREPGADAETKAIGIFTLVLTGMLMIFGLLDLQLSNLRDMIFVSVWAGALAVIPGLTVQAAKAGNEKNVKTNWRASEATMPPPGWTPRPEPVPPSGSAPHRPVTPAAPAPPESAPPAASPKPGAAFHIPSLDGLRAASFLLVFLGHAGDKRWLPSYFGLTVFFFLSGYLITTLLRMEFDRTGRINFKDFYIRRCLRIFPPFYIVLAAASALTLFGALAGSLRIDAVLAQVFHLSNYYIISHGWWYWRAQGTWVYWSLAVEEHFYLIFPLLYLFLRRRQLSARRQMLVLAGLCAAILAWRCLLMFVFHAPKDRLYVATDTRVDSILFGCILAVFGNPALDQVMISERRLKAFWLPAAGAALIVSFLIRSFPFEQTIRYTIQSVALFPIFVAAIRFPEWGLFRLLNVKWVRFLGALSYSLYLLHTTVIACLVQWTHWPTVIRGAAALGISIGLASLIHFGVEKPIARLRKRRSPTGKSVSENADLRPPLSRSRLVARNIVSMLITQVVTWGLTAVIMVFLPRYVGDVGLGRLTLAGSFMSIAFMFVYLGTSTVVIRDIAKDHARAGDYLWAILIQRLVLGLVVTAGIGVILHFVPYPAQTRQVILLSTALGIIGALSVGAGEVLRGQENIPRTNIASVVEKGIYAVMVLAAIKARMPLWVIAACAGLAAVSSLVINLTAFRGRWRRPSTQHLALGWTIMKAGSPFFASAVFMTIYSQCPPIILQRLSGDAAVGWYGLVMRLFGTVLFIPTIVTGAMLPAITRLRAEDSPKFPEAVHRLISLMLLCVAPVAAVIIFMPAQIIRLLHYPPSFFHAVPVFVLFGIGLVFWFLSIAVGTVMTAMDLQREFSRASAIVAVAVIPLSIACISVAQRVLHNGAVGAAMAHVLVEMYLLWRYLRALPSGLLPSAYLAGLFAKVSLAALPMGLMGYFGRGHWDLFALLPGVVLYVLLCALLRCIGSQDWDLLRSLVARKAGTANVPASA